jgi:hypothetical protein
MGLTNGKMLNLTSMMAPHSIPEINWDINCYPRGRSATGSIMKASACHLYHVDQNVSKLQYMQVIVVDKMLGATSARLLNNLADRFLKGLRPKHNLAGLFTQASTVVYRCALFFNPLEPLLVRASITILLS